MPGGLTRSRASRIERLDLHGSFERWSGFRTQTVRQASHRGSTRLIRWSPPTRKSASAGRPCWSPAFELAGTPEHSEERWRGLGLGDVDRHQLSSGILDTVLVRADHEQQLLVAQVRDLPTLSPGGLKTPIWAPT